MLDIDDLLIAKTMDVVKLNIPMQRGVWGFGRSPTLGMAFVIV